MKRIYHAYGEDEYMNLGKDLKKYFFGLSLFHSILIERLKYGPIGWNQKYDWMNSDFTISF